MEYSWKQIKENMNEDFIKLVYGMEGPAHQKLLSVWLEALKQLREFAR